MSNCPTCGAPCKQRSDESHGHYFAAVTQAYGNLPEDIGDDFADAEHLRAWALVKAGYRNERNILCDSEDEARRMQVAIAISHKQSGSYVFVKRTGTIVTIWTAKSQSRKAMPKAEFERSKDAVLRVLSDLIGVDVTELVKARAA